MVQHFVESAVLAVDSWLPSIVARTRFKAMECERETEKLEKKEITVGQGITGLAGEKPFLRQTISAVIDIVCTFRWDEIHCT